MSTTTSVEQLEAQVKQLQRAIYYLVWRRTGFGEQCLHCSHSYPGHEHNCKGRDIEALVRDDAVALTGSTGSGS